jgi:hypothetical protein
MTTLTPRRTSRQDSTAPRAEKSAQWGIELTASERRRVALAALAIVERRCQIRLAQIAAERRALLAQDPL